MIGVRAVAVAVCCLTVGAQSHAAVLDDLERQIREVVAQRQVSEREQARLVLEAAALADAVSAADAPGGTQRRAGAALERQLRDFDRVAGRLDGAGRLLRNYDATIARLRKAFRVELDKQRKAPSPSDPQRAAAREAAFEAARRRVDELSGPPRAFRPLLAVHPSPTDTVADLDQKLAVLSAERARGTDALDSMDRDLSVLTGRAIVTRRLLDALEAAARGAPQDLRLVQRQVEEIQRRLRDLDVTQRDVRRARDLVVQGLADVVQQIKECSARRLTLIRVG